MRGGKTSGRAIIVGIDPGTTSSYAILDTEGKLIKVRSAKELDISMIISDVTDEGTVAAAGTDKRKCPAMVAKFAAKTGARVIIPDEDLGIIEKRALTAGRDYGNWHEMDALASAANAFNVLRPLLGKIHKNLELRGKSGLKDKVTKLVITRGISINAALEMLEERKMPEESGEVIAGSYQDAKGEKRILEPGKLAAQMRMLERTNDILKRHNNKLLNALKRGKAKHRKLMAKISRKLEEKEVAGLLPKERLVGALRQRLAAKDAELGRLLDELTAAHSMLANIKGRVVLKKLDNLTWAEYLSRSSVLKIREGDVLLVSNPNVYDERAVAALREKVAVVLHRESISDRLKDSLGFAFVDADGIDFVEGRFFAVADRASLEAKKAKAGLLASIVSSYRKERQQEVLVQEEKR